jgi:hypothetical protein
LPIYFDEDEVRPTHPTHRLSTSSSGPKPYSPQYYSHVKIRNAEPIISHPGLSRKRGDLGPPEPRRLAQCGSCSGLVLPYPIRSPEHRRCPGTLRRQDGRAGHLGQRRGPPLHGASSGRPSADPVTTEVRHLRGSRCRRVARSHQMDLGNRRAMGRRTYRHNQV